MKNLDKLFNIWEASLAPFDTTPPFTSLTDMYETNDSTLYGDVHWESLVICYNVDKDPSSNEVPPAWKMVQYEGWFHDPWKLIHNIIANCSFNKEFNYAPYQEFDTDGKHCFMTYSIVIGAGEKQYIVLLSFKLKISNFVYL